jgi:hypothetical protein
MCLDRQGTKARFRQVKVGKNLGVCNVKPRTSLPILFATNQERRQTQRRVGVPPGLGSK